VAFVVALVASGSLDNVALTAAGSVVLAALFAALRFRACRLVAISVAGFALGLVIAGRHQERAAQQSRAFAAIDGSAFVAVDAPLGRGWRHGVMSWTLAVDRFRILGAATRGSESVQLPESFEAPLIISASFAPQQIGMRAGIVTRGLIRREDDGRYLLAVKSERLMAYRGRVSMLTPAGLNRWLSERLLAGARRHPERASDFGLVQALALGRSEYLPQSLRDSYRQGGTYHFLVFSGLQIALVASVIGAAARKRGRPRLADRALLGFTIAVALFAPPEASISRACFAVGLYAATRVIERPTSVENLFFLSALVRLVFVPDDLRSPGFQLTYAGAGALLLIARPLSQGRRGPHRLARLVIAGVGAEAAITPLLLYHFHQYAVGGPLLLALLAPVVGGMLTLSMMACTASIVSVRAPYPFVQVIHLLDLLCGRANAFTADWLRLSGFAMAPDPIVLILGYSAALASVLLIRRRAGSWVALAALGLIPTITVVQARQRMSVETPQMTMLDVGQGDAILLRQNRSVVLVDGGGRNHDEAFGRVTLLPMLLDRGIRRIAVVALSHAHPDHCGGLPDVVRHLTVGEVWISPRRFEGPCATALLDACAETSTVIRLIKEPRTFAVGSMLLTAIPPPVSFRRSPENNSSMIIRAVLGGRRFLLPGDVESEAEQALLRRPAGSLRADVVKVPHHGSRTSSSAAFIGAVEPRIAMISCGRRNPFGHPHDEVIQQFTRRRCRVLRTDLQGALTAEVKAGHIFTRAQIDTPR
jgi:competence protein ComEC